VRGRKSLRKRRGASKEIREERDSVSTVEYRTGSSNSIGFGKRKGGKSLMQVHLIEGCCSGIISRSKECNQSAWIARPTGENAGLTGPGQHEEQREPRRALKDQTNASRGRNGNWTILEDSKNILEGAPSKERRKKRPLTPARVLLGGEGVGIHWTRKDFSRGISQ